MSGERGSHSDERMLKCAIEVAEIVVVFSSGQVVDGAKDMGQKRAYVRRRCANTVMLQSSSQTRFGIAKEVNLIVAGLVISKEQVLC
jgi:hypothetical protein